MKIDVAYSEEYQDVIDPEKAYELYLDGIIVSPQAFSCPEPDCYAQVTLSSCRKERRYLKQKPHFRCYTKDNPHKNKCPYDNDKDIIGESDDGVEKKNNKYINSSTDILTTKRKEKKTTTTKDNKGDLIDHDRIKREIKSNVESLGKRSGKYETIVPIVIKYLRYKKDNELSNHYIEDDKGYRLSYKTMFKKIENKNYDWFSDYDRIYYGKGNILKVKNKQSDYKVLFTDKLMYRGKEYTPSIYISNKIIINSYRNKKWLEELEVLRKCREEVIIFVYGRVKIVDDKYFNLNISNAKLDFLEIKYEDKENE